ncbi:MAG: maleylacetoacetate isomerase [Legionellales bacterium]|nr:maleylacetoacetate isomerase [Legionellales bacterium]
MKLYSYFRSSAAFRVRIALNLKNVDYEIIPIHLTREGGMQHSESYLTVNPQGLVPALEHQNHIITQSMAIIEYLDEMYPQPTLLPENPYVRAQARALALSIACDIHPINNLRVLNYLTHDLKISDEERKRWYMHWIELGFSAIEQQLKAHSGKEYCCFGAQPSIADIFLIPQVINARRFHMDLTAFPRIVDIEQYCLSLPAFINALPANQPDVEL